MLLVYGTIEEDQGFLMHHSIWTKIAVILMYRDIASTIKIILTFVSNLNSTELTLRRICAEALSWWQL